MLEALVSDAGPPSFLAMVSSAALGASQDVPFRPLVVPGASSRPLSLTCCLQPTLSLQQVSINTGTISCSQGHAGPDPSGTSSFGPPARD